MAENDLKQTKTPTGAKAPASVSRPTAAQKMPVGDAKTTGAKPSTARPVANHANATQKPVQQTTAYASSLNKTSSVTGLEEQTISSRQTPIVPTSSTNGFVYNSTDGYYYYQNSSGQNVMFEPATSSAVTSRYLMQSFSIDFSSVSNLLGGNSIYMEILVESVTI